MKGEWDEEMMKKIVILAGTVLMAAVTLAAIEIPKASGKALGVTKGKPFEAGLVFVDGKYLPPPYLVERWGVGIRINGKPVVAQVVDWTEFLKTQSGVKVTKSEVPETPVAEPEAEPEAEAEPEVDDDVSNEENSLDDLFDDDPKPKKAAKKPARKKVRKARPRKPQATVSYALDGAFVPNAASKALLNRINAYRRDIDGRLRSGGFVCFGSRYAQVSGDAHTAEKILSKLPALQKNCATREDFISAMRASGIVYLTDMICEGMFENRLDYRALQERARKWKSDRDFQRMLDGSNQPLL